MNWKKKLWLQLDCLSNSATCDLPHAWTYFSYENAATAIVVADMRHAYEHTHTQSSSSETETHFRFLTFYSFFSSNTLRAFTALFSEFLCGTFPSSHCRSYSLGVACCWFNIVTFGFVVHLIFVFKRRCIISIHEHVFKFGGSFHASTICLCEDITHRFNLSFLLFSISGPRYE